MRTRLLLVVFAVAAILNLGGLYLYYTPSPKRLVGDENYYYGLLSKANPDNQKLNEVLKKLKIDIEE